MHPTISIPTLWDYPRFSFGQPTQQGIIVGLEYYCTGSQLAYQYGQGWRYAILSDKNSEEIQHYFENQIQLVSKEELLSQITAELEQHQRQVIILQQQLAAINGGRYHA